MHASSQLTADVAEALERTEPHRPREHDSQSWWIASLTALGIVFGDIGTSPLYAFQTAIKATGHSAPAPYEILGVVSLILWSLIFIVAFKYVLIVMRANNDGEGGILALLSLIEPMPQSGKAKLAFVTLLGISGAALLYGDGVITPAISVLSAIEGLKVAAPSFGHFVIPITLLVLVILFSIQSRGTAVIGSWFGPVMAVWFLSIGVIGVSGIVQSPEILSAINPYEGIRFLLRDMKAAFAVFGGVFLALTGAEALYADMGHVGRPAITRAWFGLVMPSLFLNYIGQAALVMKHPEALDNPFYHLIPSWALIPVIALAALATVIASQALISGVFSLTRQAINMRLCPRMRVVPTSRRSAGQIYIGVVNWALMLVTLAIVVAFESSSRLAAAYGIAVSATMLITTVLLNRVMVERWKWPNGIAFLVTAGFATIDMIFLASNCTKIAEGGWLPLAIGGFVAYLMVSWRTGSSLAAERQREASVPFNVFLASINGSIHRIPGCAVFLSRLADTVSPLLLKHMECNRVLHEEVVIISFVSDRRPRVPAAERIKIVSLEKGLHRVIVSNGFMQKMDIMAILRGCALQGLKCCGGDVQFYVGHETVVRRKQSGIPSIFWFPYEIMHRMASRLPDFLHLPHEQVIEVGYRLTL